MSRLSQLSRKARYAILGATFAIIQIAIIASAYYAGFIGGASQSWYVKIAVSLFD